MTKAGSSPNRSIAVIGLGMAASPHAKSLQELRHRVTVKAAYSRTENARTAFAEQYGFPSVSDPSDILHDDAISAVLLLTPPNARMEWVQSLSSSGKHILMEKPVERTLNEATAIRDICDDSRITTGVVFQNRFRDGALRLQRRMREGALGEIHTVQVCIPWWREQSYYDEPLRGSYSRDGGGVLISQAIHTLDLMLQLIGPVVEVAAIAGTTATHSMESEDFVGAGLRFANGAMGSLHATTAQFPGDLESIRLSGSRGSASLIGGELAIEYRDGTSEVVGAASSGGGSADPMAFSHEWHSRLITDFLDALDEHRDPVATIEHALQAQRLIEALLESAEHKVQVTLNTSL